MNCSAFGDGLIGPRIGVHIGQNAPCLVGTQSFAGTVAPWRSVDSVGTRYQIYGLFNI